MADEQLQSTTPWRRDPAQLEAAFEAWARRFKGEGARLAEMRVPDSGMANDTIMFVLDDEPLVARLAPDPDSPYPTFPTFDLRFQQRVMDLVRARTDVPVPEVVHYEEDETHVGVPFLVVRAIEGQVPSDNPPYLMDPGGWFLQGSPEDRARLERSTIEVLVRLHRITDSDETGFLHHDTPGDTALARQFAHQRDYYRWACPQRSVPVLEEAIERLGATLPDNDEAVLNWGDSRPGNIIYQDFEPVAVLDWEMATIGPPEVDLAWMTFFQRFFTDMAETYGLGSVPEMFQPTRTVATYEELSGRSLEPLAWYEAFAGLRFGIILARMSQRAVAYGVMEAAEDPDDSMMFPALLRQLLEEI